MVHPAFNDRTRPYLIPNKNCISDGQRSVFFRAGIIGRAKEMFISPEDSNFDSVKIDSKSFIPVRLLMEVTGPDRTPFLFLTGKEEDRIFHQYILNDLKFEHRVVFAYNEVTDNLMISFELTDWMPTEGVTGLRIVGLALAANLIPVTN